MSTINNNTNLVESSIVNGGSEYIDFSFAFNDSSFSDRIIHLEIMNDFIEVHPNADSTRHSERRREDIQKDNVDSLSDQPDVNDCALHEPQDVEADAMVEVFTAGTWIT
ncbi:unnamed protein product [Lathyrus oleraceus]